MEDKKKNCQNCGKNFEITKDDFSFYEKISVPPPTFCPECRIIRQFSHRNEKILYKRDCMVPGHTEKLISMYSPNSAMTVYDTNYWWGDQWDPMNFGEEYDFSKNFLEQFYALQAKVPRPPLVNNKSLNSEFCNFSDENKNCYLITSANRNENSLYGFGLVDNKDISDCLWCSGCELLYESIDCEKCYDTMYSQQCEGCVSSAFLFDCRGCNNCLFCVHLRNKSYYIFNKQSTKEEYDNFKKEFGKLASLKDLIQKFEDFKKKESMRKYANILKSVKSLGENIFTSKNINRGFDVYQSEDSSYLEEGLNAKNCYDLCFFDTVELSYESSSVGLPAYGCFFTIFCRDSHNLQYCDNCRGSKDLFGCVSLRNKQYCILNKQYTKEEYETLVSKIIKHMGNMPYLDKKGRIYKYGEFLPTELSPFAYNETIAQEYFSLSRGEILKRGYKWKENSERNYIIDIKNEKIPQEIANMREDIVGKVLECKHKGKCNEQCTEAFKITEEEFKFYKKMNLPPPRFCPNCRHYNRLKQRNPLKLWHRKCMKEGCTNEFETSYAPERPEIVYCEGCYNKEVY